MSAVSSSIVKHSGLQTAVRSEVWDHIWQCEPSAARDDELLNRERRGPRFAEIIRRIEQEFGSVSRVRTIELGSGRGDMSVLLAERGANVTLLDANTRALELAQRRFDRLALSASTKQANLLDLPNALHQQYDVAISLGVIEHFRAADRTTVIRAHLEALRPGGLAVISVPNAWCVSYRLSKLYAELRGCWPYGMEIPYTPRELRWRAREAGFYNIETVCYDRLRSANGEVNKGSIAAAGLHAGDAEPVRKKRLFWWSRHCGAILVLFAQRILKRAEGFACVPARGVAPDP